MNGQSSRPFNGNFSISELNEILIKEWIPYRSCCSCGKKDYCKFYNQVDESYQCGVAIKALNNFLQDTFFEVLNSTTNEKQKFLNSVFFFCKYVIQSEQINGVLINRENFNLHGWDLKAYSAMIPPIRETLNEFSKNLKELPKLYCETSILLVEGQSEMILINNLRGNKNEFRFWNFLVDCYYGRSNKTRNRLKILLDKYQENGYHVYLEGDQDGRGEGNKNYNEFRDFINDGYLSNDNVFQFKYDLETAIPKKTVYNFLMENSLLIDESFFSFDAKIQTKRKSINDCLLDVYGIDMERFNLKKRIAEYVGKFYFVVLPEEEKHFKESELGKFVEFLDRIK